MYENRVVGVMTSFGSKEGIHLGDGLIRLKFPKDTFFITRIGRDAVSIDGQDTGLSIKIWNDGGEPYIEIFGTTYLFKPFLNYEPLKRAIGLSK